VQLIPLEWLGILNLWLFVKSTIILATRLNHSEIFINEAQNAREAYEYAVIRVVPEREEFLNVGCSFL
jgi:hypothetical protein